MKKLLIILIAAAMSLAVMSGCNNDGGSEPGKDGAQQNGSLDQNPEDDLPDTQDEPDGDNGSENTEAKSCVEILAEVWNSYSEEDQFYIFGGDEEFGVERAPGKFGVEGNGQALDNRLCFPQDCESLIDDAASIIHMLNANTFTCGAFRLKNSDDANTVADKIKDNIESRHWMCGAPEEYYIASFDGYIVAAFGHEELMNKFESYFIACYPDAAVVYEESLLD